MATKIPIQNSSTKVATIALIVLGIVITLNLVHMVASFDQTNVTTKVNITNSRPIVTVVIIDEGVDQPLNITLSQGTTRNVECNVTVVDYNGHGDVNNTNATFFFSTSSNGAANDYNDHYTNSSCTKYGNDGVSTGYYTCGFNVTYFANNGSWTCNATAIDQLNTTGYLSNTTVVNALFAINVTSILDYGNLAVGDTSDNYTLNITNFGNRAINITVFGYGTTPNDGLSMNCSTRGNISVNSQRFSAPLTDFANKQVLASTNQTISNLTVIQQTDDGTPITNTTYWQLAVSVSDNPAGQCNGTLVVEAIST